MPQCQEIKEVHKRYWMEIEEENQKEKIPELHSMVVRRHKEAGHLSCPAWYVFLFG